MRLGVHVWDFSGGDGGPAAIGDDLVRVAHAAEAAGVGWLSVMDHYFQMDAVAPAEDPMLEGYTTLGFLAGHTSTVQLGLLVTGVTYRHPGLLAKAVTTLDVLSGGRAVLGIGAAWYEREHRGLGVPYPAVPERFDRLEETLRICRQMWDPENNGPFVGTHYELAETLCSPPPVSRPHPPILIGGGGERRTLRLVAQYGDACNLFAEDPQVVAHKLNVLRRHCEEVGRDESEIRKTVLYEGESLARGDLEEFVEEMRGYAGLGIETVILMAGRGEDRPAWIERVCAPAVPRLAELGRV
ncbi:LLM class F420-dependent oxidoreductase [Streptomyces sp. 4N509B]|uniref:LLM class F420-dependent oxidoreductase n=1 Tax=Streptomyces sp. 4N509B TaxID=3457413 RepID=UPI003FCEF1F9